VLRRSALAAALLLLLLGATACGSGKKQSAQTQREHTTNQPAQTAPKPVRKGVAGTIHVKTRLGTFAFKLDPASAPNATRSFVRLTKRGFFNGLVFHRIVPSFVIQGGDPTGTGTGGPGYTTHDTVPPTTTYPLGTVAMAKTGAEPPGSAGSQFFVVTGRGVQFDGPFYAVIGHVSSGMPVVLKIGNQPSDPQTQAPLKPVVMQRVTYTKS
jgi:cyclophilin family peptidyl-prolyl cis-trans isomerase